MGTIVYDLLNRKGGEAMTYYPTNRRYEQKNILQVKVGFNKSTEPELVEKIEQQENRARYIKNLVRADIECEKKRKEENK